MKKVITWFAIMLFSSSILFAQKTAVEYLNAMGTEFKAIQSATWDYTKSAANNKSARKTNKRLPTTNNKQHTKKGGVRKIEQGERCASRLSFYGNCQ